MLVALPEDLDWVPTFGGPKLPAALIPGEPVPSTGLQWHSHSRAQTHIQASTRKQT